MSLNYRYNDAINNIIPTLATEIPIDAWESISKIKSNFIRLGYDDNLSSIPLLILDSWKRSQRYNVDHDIKPIRKNINKNIFQDFLYINRNIIKILEKYLLGPGPLRLQNYTGYYLTVFDKDGLLIFATGAEKTRLFFEKLGIKPGVILSENTVGTTAHSLAIKHGKFAQLIGPYNYSSIFENCVLSAVPIFFNNEIIGAFEVMQFNIPNHALPFTPNVFGMAASMSNVISSELQIEEEKSKLKLIKSFMNILTTPSNENKGIAVVCRKGNIVYINDIASVWLNYHDSNKTLANYINDFSKIKKYFNGKETYKNIPINIANLKENHVSFNMTTHPLKDSSDKISGTVLYIGATANQSDQSYFLRYTFDSIIGKHPTIKRAKTIATNIAPTNNNVLILGESGTGKEIFAQAIHNTSNMNGHFVAINCASIPKNLIETELFGYVGGAFTDADKSGKQGKIEFANDGTLFLDEIGDMPLELQPVLLRVLEERQVTRIGGKEPINVNFRVISATNCDLYKKVLDKQFREDLYFRLAVITLDIPPLRERGNDIILLANYFIEKACKNNNKSGILLSEPVKELFLKYNWHGNIRQLESTIISAVCSVKDGCEIEVINLPRIIRETKSIEKTDSLEDVTLELIKTTLTSLGGNILETSKKLGISRATIYRKLKKIY